MAGKQPGLEKISVGRLPLDENGRIAGLEGPRPDFVVFGDKKVGDDMPDPDFRPVLEGGREAFAEDEALRLRTVRSSDPNIKLGLAPVPPGAFQIERHAPPCQGMVDPDHGGLRLRAVFEHGDHALPGLDPAFRMIFRRKIVETNLHVPSCDGRRLSDGKNDPFPESAEARRQASGQDDEKTEMNKARSEAPRGFLFGPEKGVGVSCFFVNPPTRIGESAADTGSGAFERDLQGKTVANPA